MWCMCMKCGVCVWNVVYVYEMWLQLFQCGCKDSKSLLFHWNQVIRVLRWDQGVAYQHPYVSCFVTFKTVRLAIDFHVHWANVGHMHLAIQMDVVVVNGKGYEAWLKVFDCTWCCIGTGALEVDSLAVVGRVMWIPLKPDTHISLSAKRVT